MHKLVGHWKSFFIKHWQYAPVFISALILGSPFLFTGKVLFWGTVILQFIPWRHYAWTALQSGHLPLWNPLVGMGAPLLANYQSALLYPPNWFLFILDWLGGVSWLAWGQGLLVVLHWCLAGAGMICLLNWLGVGKLGQAVGGVSFGLSSYMVGRASFLSINAAVAWLPWIILCSSILAKEISRQSKPTRRSIVFLVILLTMQLLSGHAQTTWYTIVLVFVWGGFLGYLFTRQKDSSLQQSNIAVVVGKSWLWIVVALIVAVMISAPQLFPTFEYLIQSQRSTAVDSELAMTYSFWPWRFITLLAPGMYGNPATGDYWGYGNYWEDALYIGLFPVILALWMLIGAWKKTQEAQDPKGNREKPLLIFLGGLIIISMVLALGDRTPVFPWMYKNIPTFDMFQAPTRISILAIFALTILGGIGIERVRRPIKRALYWTRLSTAGAFAITLGASLVLVLFEDVAPTFIRAFALMGSFGIVCGFIFLSAPEDDNKDNMRKTKSEVIWTSAVLIFICLDLVFTNWGVNPVLDRTVIGKMTQPEGNSVDNQRVFISAEVEYTLKFDEFMRFDTFSPAPGWEKLASVQIPNMSMLRGIPSANNFDPLLPAVFSQWEDRLDEEIESGNTETYANMLNLMGVGSVEELNLSSETLVQYRQLDNPQRVRLVNCAIPAQNIEHAMTLILENKIKVDDEVIVEGLDSDYEKICLTSNSVNSDNKIKIIAENPNYVAIQTQSTDPRWLVLADVWYPGWKVTVDGVEATAYRAHSLFRTVQVEAGQHLVEFIYRPISFYIGLSASILGIFLLIIFMVFPWKKITNL